MDRIQRQTAATLKVTFEQDGVVTDPDDHLATVRIVRADGTELVATSPATKIAVGQYGYTLTPAQTSLLDVLTATWTATLSGQSQVFTTDTEVAGGFLATLATLKADTDLASYSTDRLIEAREYAEEEIERAAQRAFVPRYRLQSLRGTGDQELWLDRPDIRSIRTASVDAVALSSTDLADLTFDSAGHVHRRAFWTRNSSILVGYEYGLDQPPRAITRATVIVAKAYLTSRVMDDRAIQRPTEDGPVYIATPGFQGHRFGLPEVDAAIDAYGVQVSVG